MRIGFNMAKAALILSCLLAGEVGEVYGQRPFIVHDPFYRGESARRTFYGGLALTTELSYRASGAVQSGEQTHGADPFGLAFKLDYAVIPSLDLSAVMDAAGSNAGRTLSLSWVAAKYYHSVDNTDYAVRVAVDPSSDGGIGFPQTDVAFLATSLLSPQISSDYSLSVRRVRMGYQRWVQQPMMPEIPENPVANDVLYTRALGWEVHAGVQYTLILNPARNGIFTGLLVDRGEYNLLETSLRKEEIAEQSSTFSGSASEVNPTEWDERFRSGTVWFRAGIEYNRPGYQLIPFASIPLKQWVPDEGVSRSRIAVGLRLMLR